MTLHPQLSAYPDIALLDYAARPGAAVPGATRSMLLLHGFGEDKHRLMPVGDALCPVGAVAVYPSLRAHGASPRPEWGYSPLDFAADLHRLADVLPEPVDVVGFSFGALVAALFAAAMGPRRVRSLVVLDQSFDADPARHEVDEWVESSFLKWHYDYRHLYDQLSAAGIPVHVVIGADSHVVSPAERQRLLDRRAAGYSAEIVDGDHAAVADDYARLIDIIAAFHRRHRLTMEATR